MRHRHRLRRVFRWLALVALLLVSSLGLLYLWGFSLLAGAWQRQERSSVGLRAFCAPGILREGELWRGEELAGFFRAHGLEPRPCAQPPLYGVCQQGSSFLIGAWLVPGEQRLLRVEAGAQGLRLTTDEGQQQQELVLVPRLLAIAPQEDRIRWPVRLHQVSPHVLNAVVDLEDRGFLSHPGLSFRGLLRASVVNLTSGGVKQGGSTITQQLVKLLLFKPERRLSRKMLEAFLASLVEYRYSKREILETYLNNVYFGQEGGVSVVGVEAASRYYFGKPARYLDLAEAALLAGIIAAPNRFNPFTQPHVAQKRRDQALEAMAREGHISAARVQQAETQPVPSRPWPLRWTAAHHFLDLLPARERGEVISTLDPVVQLAVWEGVRSGLAKLENKLGPSWRASDDPLQVAVVVLDAQGRALGLLGSREGKPGELNRALSARRPIGSLVKPFLVALALEHGWQLSDTVRDEPLSLPVGGQVWQPQNHDGRFRGVVSLEQALVLSINVPMVRLGLELGLEKVTELLKRLELTPAGTPAELLGSVEATPWQVARAYTPFLNCGALVEPRAWGPVRQGEAVFAWGKAQAVLRPLQEVVEWGTATGFAARCGRPLAAKTGTTDNRRDSWFVAIRPKLLTVVWLGTDRNRETRLYGASGAGVIWQEIDLRLPGVYKQGSWPSCASL